MADFEGTPGDDIYMGNYGYEVAHGRGGDDQLSGGWGNDQLAGDSGSDLLRGDDGDDWLFAGTLSMDFQLPYYSLDYIAPIMDTGTEVDTLFGGAGNDRLFVGYGDNVDGGEGRDYLYLSLAGATQGVTLDFSQGPMMIGGGLITNVEYISWIDGSAYDDYINAENGADGYSDSGAVFGMGGNDYLIAGYYTGSMFGGEGNDTLDARSGQYIGIVDGGEGNDVIYASAYASTYGGSGDDLIYGRGNVMAESGNDKVIMDSYGYAEGGAGNDILIAFDEGNALVGGAGADVLTGGAATDWIYSGDRALGNAPSDDMGREKDVLSGGGGADELWAGIGDDVDGGAGIDKLSYSFGGATSGISISTDAFTSGSAVIANGTIRNVEILDRVRGSEFGDIVNVATQSNLLTVDAGAGNDVVTSNNSSVNLSGGAGDDRLVSGAAADTFDGGVGADTIDYSNYKAGVTVSLGLSGAIGSGAGGDRLISVENIAGSAFDDILQGNEGNNRLDGGAGNDKLNGGWGDDTLDGGTGLDTLTGGLGDDIYFDRDGTDSIAELANQGIDTLVTQASTYTLTAHVEKLTFIGVGPFKGTGNAQDNVINSIGGGDADVLNGLGGNDTLYAGAGNDVLDGGAGVDSMYGGLGNDTYYVDNVGDVVVEQAGEGYDVVITNVDYTLGANVEGIKLLNLTKGVEVHGNGLNNSVNAAYASAPLAAGTQIRMFGEGGDDTLLGSRHDDYLDGGTGIDTMTGGLGNDSYVVDDARDVVVEQAGQGYDVVITNIDYTLGANVEGIKLLNVTRGVEVHGNSLNNSFNAAYVGASLAAGTQIRMFGEGGNDTLLGSRHGDYLDGGAGIDTMTGGFGNDTYVVDNKGDVVVEQAGQGYDVVITNIDYTLGANVEGIKLLNLTRGVEVHGNSLNNSLNAAYANGPLAAGTKIQMFGEGGNDTLLGSRNDDYLDGGTGVDTMTGGFGNDTYVVDNAGDIVVEQGGQGYDVVVTSIDYMLGANVEGLKLLNLTKGVEAHGNGLNNSLNAAYVNTPLAAGTTIRLFGEGGSDSLLGSRYGDFLDGGAGNDTLQGGGGNDRFHFGDGLNALSNVDTILDFQLGDLIELDDAVFNGLSTGALGAGAFVANAAGAATSAEQRIVYDTDSGQLFFDADGSGAGGGVLFAVLNGHPAIGVADFVVV